MRSVGLIRIVLLGAAPLVTDPALAHGLLVSIHGEGRFITGKVYYSNGELGAGQYAELTDLDVPGAKPQKGKTDAGGAFRFAGVPGHHYRFLTEGEEGHTSEMQIALAEGAKGQFIDRDAVSRPFVPPAWLVVSGILALISIPLLWTRKR